MSETKTMTELFGQARFAGVPILVIRTADQQATIKTLQRDRDGYWNKYPMFVWDAARGITAVPDNDASEQVIAAVADDSTEFADAMIVAEKMPEKAILFVLNAQRQLQSMEPIAIARNVQALANTRDELKTNHRMIVLLAPQFTAPMELEHDIIAIDHPLPKADELRTLVVDLHASAERSATTKKRTIPPLAPETLARATDAVTGLSLFEAEQVVSMSIDEKGLDVDAVWERKRVAIESVRGMKVYRGRERFADVVGCANVKARLSQRIAGRKSVGVVIVLDSI